MFVRKFTPFIFVVPVFAAIILALAQTSSAFAAETRGGNDITIASNETIDDDLYAFGQNITILGQVTGSVIAGGNTVSIAGEVGGDVMAAGSSVVVDGPVHGTIRAAGQSVQVRNQVNGDLLATGNSVSVVGDGAVGRDVLAAGSTLTIAGPVGRDVNVSGQEVRISNTVGGDVTGTATNLTLDSTARVDGSLDYTSPNDAAVAPGATIDGTIVRNEPATQSQPPVTALALDWVKGIVGWAVLGVVLLVLFPRAASRNVAMLRQSPWMSLGVGAALLVLTPLLAVTVFGLGLWVGGWWLGLLLLGAYLAWLAVGYLVSAAALGTGLLARVRPVKGLAIWSLLLGLVILAGLQLIPFVGGLVGLVAVVFGSGALLLSIASARRMTWSTLASPAHSSLTEADHTVRMPVA